MKKIEEVLINELKLYESEIKHMNKKKDWDIGSGYIRFLGGRLQGILKTASHCNLLDESRIAAYEILIKEIENLIPDDYSF